MNSEIVTYILTGNDLVEILMKHIRYPHDNFESSNEEDIGDVEYICDLATFIASDFDSIVCQFIEQDQCELIKDVPFIRIHGYKEIIEESIHGRLLQDCYVTTGFESTDFQEKCARAEEEAHKNIMEDLEKVSKVRTKEFIGEENNMIVIDKNMLEVIIKSSIGEDICNEHDDLGYIDEDFEVRCKNIGEAILDKSQGYSYTKRSSKLNFKDEGYSYAIGTHIF